MIFTVKYCFIVEPEYTTSEVVVKVEQIDSEEQQNVTVETLAPVPFLSELSSREDLLVTFTPEEQDDPNSLPFAKLVNWTVQKQSDKGSNPVICCNFELDSERVMEMDQLPVLELNVSTKDGLKKHSHSTVLQMGNFINKF